MYLDQELGRLRRKIREIEGLRKMYPDALMYDYKFYAKSAKGDVTNISLSCDGCDGVDAGSRTMVQAVVKVVAEEQRLYTTDENDLPDIVVGAEIRLDKLVHRLNENEALKRQILDLICNHTDDDENPF